MTYTPKRPDYILWFMILCAAALILSSCQTARQLIDKAEKKDPAAVAAYTRDKYPCTDLLKPDTATIYRDSVVFVDCPDTATEQPVMVMTDTVRLPGSTRTIRVPVHIPVQVQTITNWYEDSAKVKLLTLQIQALQKDTSTLHSQVITITGHRNWYRRWFFYELSLLLILLIIAAWKIWRRATTLKIAR